MPAYKIWCLRNAEPQQGVACEIQPVGEAVRTSSTDENGLYKEWYDGDPLGWRAEVIDPAWIVIGDNPAEIDAGILEHSFEVQPAP